MSKHASLESHSSSRGQLGNSASWRHCFLFALPLDVVVKNSVATVFFLLHFVRHVQRIADGFAHSFILGVVRYGIARSFLFGICSAIDCGGGLAWRLRQRRALSTFHRSAFYLSLGYSSIIFPVIFCWISWAVLRDR